MRIDELDPKHKEFKQVILDHELTEEQLDEIIPAIIGAIGGTAARALGGAALRTAGKALGGLARGAGKALGGLARGAGMAVGGIAQGVGSAVGGIAKGVGSAVGGSNNSSDQSNQGSNQVDNKNTAQDLQRRTTQGTIGSRGTTGTTPAQLQRGQELQIPQTDPKNPNKTVQTKMKVKNVLGREVELQPSKKQPGQPNVVRYDKKDLQIQ